MKSQYLYLILFLLYSCQTKNKNDKINLSEKTNTTFEFLAKGGKNSHGNLYEKKYPNENDSITKYKKWQGVKVESNEQLRQLFKSHPNIEAIEFYDWTYDPNGMFKLDEVIGDFKNLKYLEIRSRILNEYPKEIENLLQLEEIHLEPSQKTKIEFSFENFQNLKHLTIHFADHLKEFPKSIFKCTNLENLRLFRFHNINDKELEGIESLVNLKELFIWDSNLNLPLNSKYDFKKMEKLVYDRMRVSLPDYFYSSKSIKKLALSSMGDTLNLSKISKMKNLEYLKLDYFKKFEGTLNIKNLEEIHIADHRNKEINIDFNILPNLNVLSIWGCDYIKKLKPISNQNLKSITLVANDNLKNLPLKYEQLNALEELIVISNDSLKVKPRHLKGVTVKENWNLDIRSYLFVPQRDDRYHYPLATIRKKKK